MENIDSGHHEGEIEVLRYFSSKRYVFLPEVFMSYILEDTAVFTFSIEDVNVNSVHEVFELLTNTLEKSILCHSAVRI